MKPHCLVCLLLLFTEISFAQSAADIGSTIVEQGAGHMMTSKAYNVIDKSPQLFKVLPRGVWRSAASEVFGGKINPVVFGFSLAMNPTAVSTQSDREKTCLAKMTVKGALEYWSMSEGERSNENKKCEFADPIDCVDKESEACKTSHKHDFENFMNAEAKKHQDEIKSKFSASCESNKDSDEKTLSYENEDTPKKINPAYKDHKIKMDVVLDKNGNIIKILATIKNNYSGNSNFVVDQNGIVSKSFAASNDQNLRSKVIWGSNSTSSTYAMDQEYFKQMIKVEMTRIRIAAANKNLCKEITSKSINNESSDTSHSMR